MKKCGSFSGSKLNFKKRECFPVNDLARKIDQASIPFQLACLGFKYLGVHITQSLVSLHTANFTPLLENIKNDFQWWNNLPLSLSRRIQSVKGNILPKFLYLFQCLLLFLPKRFFHSIDKVISTFIWAGKNSRVGRSLLQ